MVQHQVPVPAFRILHALALKRAASADLLSTVTRLDDSILQRTLAEIEDAGLAQWRDDVRGFVLTEAGRRAHSAALQEEMQDGERRNTVAHTHSRFLTMNPHVLDLATRWQLRPEAGQRVPNDHTDPDYDRRCIEDLANVHCQAKRLLRPLTRTVPHFQTYPDRLDDAYRRVRVGEVEYFTGLQVESYHTLWFELHQDLLMALGLDRGDEYAARSPDQE